MITSIAIPRKHVITALMLLVIHGFTYMLLLPYVQQTANSHMNAATAMGLLYYLMGTILLISSIPPYLKFKDITLFTLLILIVTTFMIWGYSLSTVYCMRCASME